MVTGDEEGSGGVVGGGVFGFGMVEGGEEDGLGGEVGAGGGVGLCWDGLAGGGGVGVLVEVVVLGGRGLDEDSPPPWSWLLGSRLFSHFQDKN